MQGVRWAVAFVVLVSATTPAAGLGRRSRDRLAEVGPTLSGQVLDYTRNHGSDNRIWSPALGEKRDLYIYLPPGYSPHKQYPLLLYLHGFTQDEQDFLKYLVQPLDRAIADGRLPPTIVVMPDGSIRGRPSYLRSASFFANSDAGRFEDYLIDDIIGHVMKTFPVRPEREARAIVGGSMGGGSAFHLAMKHKHLFASVVGIFPAINLRWVNCKGHYRADFDPEDWGWRSRLRPFEIIGAFYGVLVVHYKHLSHPITGFRPDAIQRISEFNSIESIDRYHVKPGEFGMYIGYVGRDQLNLDAQVDSFLYRARQRGLKVDVEFHPEGRHDVPSGLRLLPGAIDWLGPRLAHYNPDRGN